MAQRRIPMYAGERFGRLVTVETDPRPGHHRWRCLCDCGVQRTVAATDLRRGHTTSCGCTVRTCKGEGSVNATRSPEYRTYSNIKDRCLNPKSMHWSRYGGRGIAICSRWLASYENFLEDMGRRPHGTSLDRIDNDGPYSPENCRWATPREQARNRRNNVRLTFRGETLVLSEWSERVGIALNVLQLRIAYGWTVERTLTQSVRRRRRSRD